MDYFETFLMTVLLKLVLGIYNFGWSSGARKLGDRCKTALMAKCESFCLQACRL